MRIVRRLGIAAVLLALVSVGVGFAVLYTADSDFLAGALSRLLGRHVEIGHVAFHFGRRLEVELDRVRIDDASGPDAPPVLEVAHARGVQAWPRLLAGQYVPLDWTLDAPLLRVHPSVSGDSIDLSGLPRLGLAVTDGRVEWKTAAGELWSLQRLKLDAARAGFGTRIEGQASAQLLRGETPISELDTHFSASRDHLNLRGNLAGLELVTLPKGMVSPRGRAQGSFDLTADRAGIRGKTQLTVDRLELALPKYNGPIAPKTAQLSADVDWKNGSLSLELHPLQLDDLVANGSVRLGTGANGRFSADLRLDPFEPGKPDRVSGLNFLTQRFNSWARVKTRIEAGIAEDIHLTVDVPRATLKESLSYDTPMAPEAFVLELRVRDGTYRPKPGESALEHLQGELEIRGNVMDIRRVRMTEDGEALPEINIHLDGMNRLVHLPDDEDHVSGGPGVPLSGLRPMSAAFRASDSQAKDPTVVRFADLDLRLPQLMLPLRAASGELRFPDGGVLAQPVTGIVGGAPAEVSVKWERAADRVEARIHYLDGTVPDTPTVGPRWLAGKVDFTTLHLPDWPFEGLHARLVAERAQVTVTGIEGKLSGGQIQGSGHLDLSQADKAPFDLELGVSDFDPAPVCANFGLPAESVSGRGYVKLQMAGSLHPGGEFGKEGTLSGTLILRDGTVARLPGLVAIARLPSLQGVNGLLGKPLPYRTVQLELALQNGKLAVSDGKLLGPELRILGNGELDLTTPQRQTDFVVALLFLQTLDRVLDQVPIVRNVVLGEDENLIAVYLHLQGPRDDLKVTPLPPAMVQNVVGFASSAVVNGVKSLGRLMRLSGPKSPPPESSPQSSTNNP
ncbi:MAG TPA: AsmA-like C-terminal domain-containing protein [Myxococcota bacterium]|nr:AsmA-like C-terminal domain-containing protein [Myxococcota bacterium]